MEKFYLEKPSIKRKIDAIEYIEEHMDCGSNINGSGKLDFYIKEKTYEEWLSYLEEMKKGIDNFVPSSTYFLIRENDDKIVGMINIRHKLNDALLIHGGHIGYGIRPKERMKGYNKINLYLGLIKCKNLGIKKVLLTAYDDNKGSVKTILAFDGVLENKIKENDNDVLLGRYWVNVEESLESKKEYQDKIIVKD